MGDNILGAYSNAISRTMDPMFMTFSQVNGVPQESKLAQYMKRQAEGPPTSTAALTKNLSSISLNDPVPVTLKKVVSAPTEFVPRSGASPLSYEPAATPTNASPTPQPPPYQENVGGTTYFYSSTGEMSSLEDGSSHQGASGGSKPQPDSFFVSSHLRLDLLRKNALTLSQAQSSHYQELPLEVDQYHELVVLEPVPGVPRHQSIPFITSTYKATHLKNGNKFCLKRIHGFRLPNSKCMLVVDMWKKLNHSNIVQLREVFTTKAFGDNSMVFVYDYHPESETLMSRHFSQSEAMNGYTESFSSNPNAPRPYSHQKNALLRQQHSNGMLAESLLWNYVIQLSGAVCAVHTAGLALRGLHPNRVLYTGRSRLRISSAAIVDVITFDSSSSNPLQLVAHYQQEDLNSLGRLVLALACRSLVAVQRENLQTSVEVVGRTYSADLRNLIVSLLSAGGSASGGGTNRRSIIDLMHLIGARYYSQLDYLQLHSDSLYTELAKEIDNGRLFRLITKLAVINERPELEMDPTWSETGDRYMLKLFRDHIFHQVTEVGRPFLDMSHIIHNLNKLDAGSHEKVCLMSRCEQSILVVTYAELKQCLEQSFSDLAAKAPQVP